MPDACALREAVAVYRSAFAQPPYGETAEMAEALAKKVERYAREREGLRLAVSARPGTWWRDKVAGALPQPPYWVMGRRL